MKNSKHEKKKNERKYRSIKAADDLKNARKNVKDAEKRKNIDFLLKHL